MSSGPLYSCEWIINYIIKQIFIISKYELKKFHFFLNQTSEDSFSTPAKFSRCKHFLKASVIQFVRNALASVICSCSFGLNTPSGPFLICIYIFLIYVFFNQPGTTLCWRNWSNALQALSWQGTDNIPYALLFFLGSKIILFLPGSVWLRASPAINASCRLEAMPSGIETGTAGRFPYHLAILCTNNFYT